MSQQQVVTMWVSTLNEPPERVRSGYEQETSIADDLRNGILLPANTTSCNIPPGIFVDVDTFSIDVTAVGNDYFDDTAGLVVRGRIRSVWNAVKMSGMPAGMPGFGMPGMGGGQGTELQVEEEEE